MSKLGRELLDAIMANYSVNIYCSMLAHSAMSMRSAGTSL